MAVVHEFDPVRETRREEVFVVAHCACGWRGNSFPASDDGYSDARVEFDNHQEASRHSQARNG